MFYTDVILPLPLHGLYTYAIPFELISAIQVGKRVIVQFGKKKYYTAIVQNIYKSEKTETEVQSTIKEIVTILDDIPIVTTKQLELWSWIASYYMCSVGDVYRAALPSVLKLESETYVTFNSDFQAIEASTNKENDILRCLSEKPFTISELEKKTKIPNIIPTIKSLVDKGAILISENIQHQYKAKTETAVRLTKAYSDEELIKIVDSLERAKKQQALLLSYLDLYKQHNPLLKKYLLEKSGLSAAVLNELNKKGFLETYEINTDRIHYGETDLDAAYTLNPYQQKAYDEIQNCFKTKDVTLLNGVTSSGKTEIYIQLIKNMIAKGKQVLYLLPEIALTTQITTRLKNIFGNKLAVYHSKFNNNERAEIWNKLIRDDECKIVLGARSAVFLPFKRLGLIIVDEEHESSYKQQDPAPRYNARNVAIVVANIFQAKTLLGTATPSIESYYNTTTDRYGLVRLTKRYEEIELPHIQIVNTKELRRKKQMKSVLSLPLIQQIQEALSKKEQIILFQNRRGFASLLECKTCSWTLHCKHCDVSLTYHKGQRMMACHYCGATYLIPTICPECGTATLETLGYGTERIEEETTSLFSEASIARMDLDTTRGKRSYEQIISDFEDNRTNILIGTQMVSKGLDFENVSTVGVLNADNLLNYPDFRAHERAFQLLTQVSGRAGRKNRRGLVLLQTGQPSHPIINFVKNNDYESFYQLQLDERRLFHYPPFVRLIDIVIRGRNENNVDKAAKQFAISLKQSFGERVLGPTKPPVSRIQSLYIRKILLKIENQASIQKVRDIINQHQTAILQNPDIKSVLIHFDVDPM